MAVDNEQDAVEIADANAHANGVELTAYRADALVDDLPRADLVIANVALDVVEALLPRLDARLAITSGYLERDEPHAAGWHRARAARPRGLGRRPVRARHRGLMRAAVLGATGTIGVALVRELAKEHDVVAISSSGSTSPADRVMPRALDVSDRDALAGALEGVDVVYHLVDSLGSDDFEERDRSAADAVAAASASAPVRARSSTSVGSETTRSRCPRICEAAPRPRNASSAGRCP